MTPTLISRALGFKIVKPYIAINLGSRKHPVDRNNKRYGMHIDNRLPNGLEIRPSSDMDLFDRLAFRQHTHRTATTGSWHQNTKVTMLSSMTQVQQQHNTMQVVTKSRASVRPRTPHCTWDRPHYGSLYGFLLAFYPMACGVDKF